MNKSLVFAGLALSAWIMPCRAQSPNGQPDPLSSRGGFAGSGEDGARLYDLSIFAGYSSAANPLTDGFLTTPSVGTLNADENYGASATVGWQKRRDRGSFSVRYSGSYAGSVHYSQTNGYSQWLNISGEHKLGRKWDFTLTGSGQDATLIQVVNEPSALSITSQLPSDFNDFAASFGLGSYSTAQAASTILGAPVEQAPLRALLLGNKVLNYAANAGLSYNYSPHLSFHVNGFASGGQSRSTAVDGVAAINYVLPHSLGGDAGMSWTYSPSPRTDFGANLDANLIRNSFQQAYTGTATVSAARKMGMHWFARVYGGATYTDITHQDSGTPQTKQAVGGGTLGVKTQSNIFAASYNRNASDSYGSVVGTYVIASGTWTHHHPGDRLTTMASIGQQQVTNTGFESFSGWTASGGITERLTNNTQLSAQYVYLKTGGTYLATSTNFNIQSVRLTMSWTPQVVQH